MRKHILLAAISAAIVAQPAYAQKTGKGGMGIDKTADLPRCSKPLGSIALVEEKTGPSVEDQLPPGMRALVQLAERQNGGSPSKVDPIPVLKLLTARSNCFALVERGTAFDALQRERELAGGGSVANGTALNKATLRAADYLLSTSVLYSDGNSGGGGGGIGGLRLGDRPKDKDPAEPGDADGSGRPDWPSSCRGHWLCPQARHHRRWRRLAPGPRRGCARRRLHQHSDRHGDGTRRTRCLSQDRARCPRPHRRSCSSATNVPGFKPAANCALTPPNPNGGMARNPERTT